MALQTLQDIVFQNLRSNTQGRQVCLVDVAGDSVAVFPVDHRIEQIRRNSVRKGFAAGVAAGAVVALLCVYLWSVFRQAPAPMPQAEAAAQPAPAADPAESPRAAPVEGAVQSLPAAPSPQQNPPVTAPVPASPAPATPALASAASSSPPVNTQPDAAPAAAAAPNPAGSNPADSSAALKLQNLKNEAEVLKASAVRLAGLAGDEKLVFVGSYGTYAAALSVFTRLHPRNEVLLIRGRTGGSRAYLILVRPPGPDQEFEKFRREISTRLGVELLKWNRAQRYQAVIDRG